MTSAHALFAESAWTIVCVPIAVQNVRIRNVFGVISRLSEATTFFFAYENMKSLMCLLISFVF